jgi:hypothetical protein
MRRLFSIVILALLLSMVLAGSPLAIHSQPPVSLICLSPPDRLELPAGQGVEVLCTLQGTSRAASVALRVDGQLLAVEDGPAAGAVAFAWVPAQVGPHTLMIAAEVPGHGVVTAAWQVTVMPAGSPVRIR